MGAETAREVVPAGDEGAFWVRTEVRLSADMMTAALFTAGMYPILVTAGDVGDDGGLFGVIAQVVQRDGTGWLEHLAITLPISERNGDLSEAGGLSGWEWLAFCRRRIAGLTGVPPARLIAAPGRGHGRPDTSAGAGGPWRS